MGTRIVVGVDGSEHRNAALRWVLDEAHLRQRELVAFFACQLPMIGVPGAFDRDEIERFSAAFLDETLSAVSDKSSVPITRVVAQGDVSVSLTKHRVTQTCWCLVLAGEAASPDSNSARLAKRMFSGRSASS
jgi:hypothetical protein